MYFALYQEVKGARLEGILTDSLSTFMLVALKVCGLVSTRGMFSNPTIHYSIYEMDELVDNEYSAAVDFISIMNLDWGG